MCLRAVAELASIVDTPAMDAPRGAQRARLVLSDAKEDRVCDVGVQRHVARAPRGSVAEVPCAVRAPAHDLSRGAARAGVALGLRELDGVGEADDVDARDPARRVGAVPVATEGVVLSPAADGPSRVANARRHPLRVDRGGARQRSARVRADHRRRNEALGRRTVPQDPEPVEAPADNAPRRAHGTGVVLPRGDLNGVLEPCHLLRQVQDAVRGLLPVAERAEVVVSPAAHGTRGEACATVIPPHRDLNHRGPRACLGSAVVDVCRVGNARGRRSTAVEQASSIGDRRRRGVGLTRHDARRDGERRRDRASEPNPCARQEHRPRR